MDKNSKHGTTIEWTHANGYKGETWNPVVGCSKVSTGCRECYAEQVHRLRLNGKHGYPEFRPWTALNASHNVTLMPHKLDQPVRWKKPRMVFVNSMSDLFHEQIADEYICRVFDVMRVARQHIFQVLTKRPERMRDFCRRLRFDSYGGGATDDTDVTGSYGIMGGLPGCSPLANVWLGVSIESRKWIERANVLRDTPAAVRFISAEPLLGPLIAPMFEVEVCEVDGRVYPASQVRGTVDRTWMELRRDWSHGDDLDLSGIDWLIVGGESGSNHRPLDVQWMRDLRDACKVSEVAYFTKQMGGTRPGTALEDLPEDLRIRQMPRVVGRGACA